MPNPLEDALRSELQPLLRDELMRSWRDGVKVGLQMAYDMAERVRNEAATRLVSDMRESEKDALAVQVTVLGGLMSGLKYAKDNTDETGEAHA